MIEERPDIVEILRVRATKKQKWMNKRLNIISESNEKIHDTLKLLLGRVHNRDQSPPDSIRAYSIDSSTSQIQSKNSQPSYQGISSASEKKIFQIKSFDFSDIFTGTMKERLYKTPSSTLERRSQKASKFLFDPSDIKIRKKSQKMIISPIFQKISCNNNEISPNQYDDDNTYNILDQKYFSSQPLSLFQKNIHAFKPKAKLKNIKSLIFQQRSQTNNKNSSFKYKEVKKKSVSFKDLLKPQKCLIRPKTTNGNSPQLKTPCLVVNDQLNVNEASPEFTRERLKKSIRESFSSLLQKNNIIPLENDNKTLPKFIKKGKSSSLSQKDLMIRKVDFPRYTEQSALEAIQNGFTVTPLQNKTITRTQLTQLESKLSKCSSINDRYKKNDGDKYLKITNFFAIEAREANKEADKEANREKIGN